MFGHIGVGPGGAASTALYQGHPPVNLHYRPLQQSDFDALKAIHRDLFPIDYEEVFFRKAVAGEDRVFSWAALHKEYGRDFLVGFVTARMVYLYECDPMDRHVLGLNAKCLDGEGAVYVLTLGVVPACRQCGIARSLLGLVQQHAARLRCRAVFLHVISYNDAAMRLYSGAGYQPMARLPNFYHLVTGRQPNPDQSWYDAFLYALFIPSSGPEPTPAMQWAGGMLGAAVAPLRAVLGTFNGCMPSWFCRQTYSTFLPFSTSAAGGGTSQRSASKGSLSDTATSAWQQQQLPRPSTPAPPPQQLQLHQLQQQQFQQQQQQSQQQQQLLFRQSRAAGVVCAGVTAEQFLQRGHPQQQQQHLRCSVVDRRLNDTEASSQTSAGVGAVACAGQGSYNKRSASVGPDSCGVSSSAASSASVNADQHPQLNAAPPTPTLPPRQALQQNLFHHQLQHQNSHFSGAPSVLRPPSPPMPPNHAPGMTSLQQRHPRGSGSGASTPLTYAGGGGGGNYRAHQYQNHQQQHHQNYQGGYGGAPHGRNNEHSRGGIHRGAGASGPQGLAGGGLHGSSQPAPPVQPQSVLAALFRPPSAQQHPHSR